MRPISVRFRCFGPYIKEQTIRFDELAEYGLFLICGETGSGKTTILDAMCCALYGSCSGDIRGELDAMRCKQADPGDPTEVEFVFESGGSRYRFGRKLIPRRSRKADTAVSYNEDFTCQREAGSSWIPLLDNCKKKSMNAKAAELIGLDLNQFRQVIILPQGKFETLLTSNSEDKESILSSLFHTERWKTAVDRMADELNGRKGAIDREDQTIREGLARLQASAVEELPAAAAEAEKEAEEAAAAEKAAEAAKQQAQELRDLNNDYAELDRRLKKLDDAKKAAEGDHGLQVRLDMAVRAEKAHRPHDEWKQAAGNQEKAGQRLKETEEQLAQAEAELKKASDEKAAHEALADEQRKRTEEQQRLSVLRERYESISALRKAADDAENERKAAEQKAETAHTFLNNANENLRKLLDAWNAAEEEYRKVSRAYQEATAGHLAAALQEGQPCPVCGSIHHPAPAQLSGDAVKDTDVDKADSSAKKARKAYDSQVGMQKQADTDARSADQALTEAKAKYSEAKGALDQGLAQLDPELKTLEALDTRAGQLNEAIRDYETKKGRLDEAYNQANLNRDTLKKTEGDRKEEKAAADQEYAEKETAWKKALEETGLGTESQYSAMILSVEDQQKLRDTMSEHAAAVAAAEKALKEQQEKLAGKVRPDPETVEAGWLDAEQKLKDAIESRTLAAQKRDHLKEETARLTELDAKIADKRKAFEEDSAFVRALRGSTGMSIQRYVLSVRLGQVIAEANRLLSGIYGGRYRLHRSNDSYGSAHKSGLELEVYDSMSDQQRSVCTLSGGEKFLVALSLAIGLCTVVQNEQKGVSLEAMFIDEGFGSLDQSSLYDALDVLKTVQRGRGLVGIISHIPLLEETIPTKIITEKTAHGSTVAVQLG